MNMEKKDAVDSAIEIILYATKKAREIIFKIKVLIGRLKAKNAESEVYYVNGPDVLPPPLTKEEEAECIENIAVDPEARNKLIEHNLRLVVYIAKVALSWYNKP